jgi:hypothetical protein
MSPCEVCVLKVLPVLVLRRASSHGVFTIASFLVMWRLRLESPPTIHGHAYATESIERMSGGAVALY